MNSLFRVLGFSIPILFLMWGGELAAKRRALKNTGPIESLFVSELREISNSADPEESEKRYQKEIERILSSVEIVNDMSPGLVKGDLENDPETGVRDAVRVCSWNIRRSEEVREIASYFRDPEKFKKTIPKSFNRKQREVAYKQYEKLKNCDVFLLQEMLHGTEETGYGNATAILAEALGMNYSFAPYQIERDPQIIGEGSGVDESKYQGLFGTAVLSRSKIVHAENSQYKHEPYSWSVDEGKRLASVEKIKRVGAKVLFNEEQKRELKIGGRGIHRVDVHLEGAKNDTLSIFNIHLEVKTTPRGRRKQLLEVFEKLGSVDNPIVVAGDFNSTQSDISPTNLFKIVKDKFSDPETFIDWAISNGLSNGLIIGYMVQYFRYFKNHNNPYAPSIPILASNSQKQMFNDFKKHRHKGWCFDLEGKPGHSYVGRIPRVRRENKIPLIGQLFNKQVFAGNSNHRSGIPFRENGTFRTKRTLGSLGHERLDSSFMTFPCDQDEEDYFLRPQFGEILSYANGGNNNPLVGASSGVDHHPISFVFSTQKGGNREIGSSKAKEPIGVVAEESGSSSNKRKLGFFKGMFKKGARAHR